MDDFSNLIGKRIEALFMDGKDEIGFVTEEQPYVFVAYGDCCSRSWFEHVSGIQCLVGHVINSVEEISMAEIPEAEQANYECLQSYGFRFTTDKGYFELEMRNSSNGYYGGYIQYMPGATVKDMKRLEEDF